MTNWNSARLSGLSPCGTLLHDRTKIALTSVLVTFCIYLFLCTFHLAWQLIFPYSPSPHTFCMFLSLRAQTKFYSKFYLQCFNPYSKNTLWIFATSFEWNFGDFSVCFGCCIRNLSRRVPPMYTSQLLPRGILPVLLGFSPDDAKGPPNEKF